jgi:hypothetical protein
LLISLLVTFRSLADVTIFSGAKLPKLLASQFIFGSVGELVLGSYLIYRFRIFERRLGSARFLSYTVMSSLLSISMQMFLLVLFPGFDNGSPNKLAPGPYSYRTLSGRPGGPWQAAVWLACVRVHLALVGRFRVSGYSLMCGL